MSDPDSPSDDPFMRRYQESELRIASEFLSDWLPFLSRDLCLNCSHILSHRILALSPHVDGGKKVSKSRGNYSSKMPNNDDNADHCDCDSSPLGNSKDDSEPNSFDCRKDGVNVSGLSESLGAADTSSSDVGDNSGSPEFETSTVRKSWADMAQEEELERNGDDGDENRRDIEGETSIGESNKVVRRKTELSRQQREYLRIKNVRRKKDFVCFRKVGRKVTNILEGLELHTGVFSAVEQKKIVNHVYELMEKGKNGELKERTFTAPRKWMKGKGRVTIQFGCCYNYATDKNGNPPGILKREEVDPLPSMFKVIIKRLIGWSVLPPSCVPDSCIVNIYDEGDCIPPHIDNHDFVRPFCTISFLSECNILFGTDLKIKGPGEFSGDIEIPLPVGSVLVLNGNGADVAKHCVPAVPSKRISITFRKMDKSKQPVYYFPEPDLQGLEPLDYDEEGPSTAPSSGPPQVLRQGTRDGYRLERKIHNEDGSSTPSSAPPQVVWQGTRDGYRFKRKSLEEPRYSATIRAALKGPSTRVDLGGR